MKPPASRTLPDLLDELAARQADHELIVGGGQRLSYAETRAQARRLARGLRGLGVGRGEMVALLMDNRPEWLVVGFAVTMLGATLVPISTWSRPRELEYVLNHCQAATLVTIPGFGSQDYLSALGQSTGRLPHLRRIIVAAEAPPGGMLALDGLARGCGLHPLHLRHHLGAQGRTALPWQAHRQHVEHRRAPAPDTGRPHVDGHFAVLELRLRQRAARRDDPRRHHRPAGAPGAGGGPRPHRARTLHGLLRHAQHRP